MKDQSVETLAFDDGNEETNVMISAFQNFGDFVAFRLSTEEYSEVSKYLLEKSVRLFHDDADNEITYLLSKKSGKIYYVGSIGIADKETDKGAYFGSPTAYGNNILVKDNKDTNENLIISEENETLNIKELKNTKVQSSDCYGNILTNTGFISSDFKNHKFSSFFDGKKYEYTYVEMFDKFYANCDDTLYSLNEKCEFVLAKETFNVLPTVNLTCYPDPVPSDFCGFANINDNPRHGENLSYFVDLWDEDTGEESLSWEDVYNLSESKIDRIDPYTTDIASPISVSKSWTWAPFAFYWMYGIKQGRSNLMNDSQYSDRRFSRFDKDYIEKWGYLYDKLFENKCQGAMEEEVTEMIHQALISNIIERTGSDYEEGSYQLGQFNDDGYYEVTCRNPVAYVLPYLGKGQNYYEYEDIKFFPGNYSIVKNKGNVYTISDRFCIGSHFLSSSILRGKNLYAMDDKNVIYKFDFTTLSLDNYELIDTGDYSVSDMYVEDGNIVVTGIDENLDQFTGYLDENDQISFEKVDFGGESSYTLYPIN